MKWLRQNNLKESTVINFCEKKNIVIGPNGGGKTRFLNAVKNHYENDVKYKPYQIVFADFTRLTYEKNTTNSKKQTIKHLEVF